jgi:hypothetical protein
MTEWQPIETAPQGGTVVLVFPNLQGYCTVGHCLHDEWWDAFNDNYEIYPTHWMPLPEPPK